MRRRRIVRRRRTRVPRMLKRMNVHHFKRTFTLTPINSATSPVFGGYAFTLSQLPNASEFQNLYDQYRINKILIRFVPNRSESNVQTGTTAGIAQFNTILDYNDATAPTTLNELYEYANWRMTRGISIHKRLFTPASVDFVSGVGGAASGSNPTWKQWLSTSADGIQHFGLKYGLGATAAAQDIIITPYVTVFFSCKFTK